VYHFPPCRALHAAVCAVRRFNLTLRAMPMFLVPAVRLTLSLPNCIRKLRNMVLLFRSHRKIPITRNEIVIRQPAQSGGTSYDRLRQSLPLYFRTADLFDGVDFLRAAPFGGLRTSLTALPA
jgi:hypothetical protein